MKALTVEKRRMLHALDNSGILQKELLDDIWSEFPERDFLIDLLKNFHLVKKFNVDILVIIMQ